VLTDCEHRQERGVYERPDSLEGARLQAAPHIVLEDFRHGWEAVPFQSSNSESISASCESRILTRILIRH
jgi:hypothetical protein